MCTNVQAGYQQAGLFLMQKKWIGEPDKNIYVGLGIQIITLFWNLMYVQAGIQSQCQCLPNTESAIVYIMCLLLVNTQIAISAG